VNYQSPSVNYKYNGFTLIEILIVISVFATLISFATINFLKPQHSSSISSAVTTLSADLKQQQLKAMVGDTEGLGTAQNYGVHIDQNSYTLFRTNPPGDFTVNLNPSLEFTTYPVDITFAKKSGELVSQNTVSVTVKHIQSNEQKSLSINQLGAITIN